MCACVGVVFMGSAHGKVLWEVSVVNSSIII